MANNTYFTSREIENIHKLEEILTRLPDFCLEFFIGIEQKYSVLTRVAYARDFETFFYFLVTKVPIFSGKDVTDLTLKDLDKVTLTHLELYLSYLTLFTNKDGVVCKNNEQAKLRKISSVRSLFKYFYNKEKLSENVASKIIMPKIHDKEIIRLDKDEVGSYINTVEVGSGLSIREQSYHKLTKTRDVAIVTLLLGTGIRISELVGIDLTDVDFEKNAFRITRKGGKQVVLYFSNEVATALYDYYQERIENEKVDENEMAFFLSMQNKRIGIRTVENLVKKYAKIVTPLKNISPHKLRSTYGTELYRETRDIYVVAEVLGHNDVNTTKKHYAAIGEDIRKNASTAVKLREDSTEE